MGISNVVGLCPELLGFTQHSSKGKEARLLPDFGDTLFGVIIIITFIVIIMFVDLGVSRVCASEL